MHLQPSSSNASGSFALLAQELLTLTDSEVELLIRDSSEEEARAIQAALNESASLRCAGRLETFASHISTKDEHTDGSRSVRPFPTRAEKPYVWLVLDRMQRDPQLLVEKSRQLMLTWCVCLYALWVAKYQANRLVMIQSKKFEDAAALVFSKDAELARISFMEAHLPDYLRTADFSQWREGYGLFPNGSQIMAIPEGGDQIRSRTPSLVISDEFAFQPEGENAWKAIKPLIDSKGGRFIGISTACGGSYMQQLIAR